MRPGRLRAGLREDFDLDDMNALSDFDEDVDQKGPQVSSARGQGQSNKAPAVKEQKKPLYDDLDDLDALEDFLA